MNLTKVQLDKVTELAHLTIFPRLIAVAIEVDEIEFIDEINTPGTPARNAYFTGVLNQMVETRAAVIKSAQNGSNPAQSELLKFIEKQIYLIDK